MKHDLILDFDETLFYTSKQTRIFLNHYFGIQIPIDDKVYLCGHSLHELVLEHLSSDHKLTEGDLYEILGSEFLSSLSWHEDVSPVDGMLEIVPELAKVYTLHVATARQSSSKPVVNMLLDKFLPGLISSTHFVWEHLGNKEFRGVPKKDFVRSLRSPIGYVDDNPKETKEIIGLAPHVILLDPKGYHPKTLVANYYVSRWEDVPKILP